ncbi:hypothetical protein DEU56DRAFT_568083 [Suillus clintonianus]|uniref:uncharacterized protein n=1 Tax=Suillus clintonianus TaxID=1904413 RepID=UPI001B865F33|nr:uncharacterized protein DEU56DRAFT_568083 [Suillus clintonianus]KAG2125477.1 hypothetical protein DEU56DRAFT_568083 [Suillus clintonianus]
MYQAPQLLACFLMPLSLKLQCLLPMDDIDQMEGQQTMYTSDPTHRILCLVACYPHTQVFIVTTSIFFDLDKTAAETPIPWNRWGPSNTRVFEPRHQCKVQVSGTRVLMTFPFGMRHAEYVLHVMDFSPLAVTNRRGLGRVVNEPSTIVTSDITGRSGDNLTTSLPYVDVILNGRFGSVDSQLHKVWIDKDRIYLFKIDVGHVMAGSTLGLVVQSTRLDVIDV